MDQCNEFEFDSGYLYVAKQQSTQSGDLDTIFYSSTWCPITIHKHGHMGKCAYYECVDHQKIIRPLCQQLDVLQTTISQLN